MKVGLTVGIVVAAMFIGLTAEAQVLQPRTAMSNADVAKMAQSGLSEEVIGDAVASSPATVFDLSPDGLVMLRYAGVSDSVIRAMQARSASRPGAISGAAAGGSLTAAISATEWQKQDAAARGARRGAKVRLIIGAAAAGAGLGLYLRMRQTCRTNPYDSSGLFRSTCRTVAGMPAYQFSTLLLESGVAVAMLWNVAQLNRANAQIDSLEASKPPIASLSLGFSKNQSVMVALGARPVVDYQWRW